jgi:hypothetical protein
MQACRLKHVKLIGNNFKVPHHYQVIISQLSQILLCISTYAMLLQHLISYIILGSLSELFSPQSANASHVVIAYSRNLKRTA